MQWDHVSQHSVSAPSRSRIRWPCCPPRAQTAARCLPPWTACARAARRRCAASSGSRTAPGLFPRCAGCCGAPSKHGVTAGCMQEADAACNIIPSSQQDIPLFLQPWPCAHNKKVSCRSQMARFWGLPSDQHEVRYLEGTNRMQDMRSESHLKVTSMRWPVAAMSAALVWSNSMQVYFQRSACARPALLQPTVFIPDAWCMQATGMSQGIGQNC